MLSTNVLDGRGTMSIFVSRVCSSWFCRGRRSINFCYMEIEAPNPALKQSKD